MYSFGISLGSYGVWNMHHDEKTINQHTCCLCMLFSGGGLLELLFQSTAWCQVGRGGGEWCREPSEMIWWHHMQLLFVRHALGFVLMLKSSLFLKSESCLKSTTAVNKIFRSKRKIRVHFCYRISDRTTGVAETIVVYWVLTMPRLK